MLDNKSEIKYFCECCVCCGEEVPEGRMVCQNCESKINNFSVDNTIKI